MVMILWPGKASGPYSLDHSRALQLAEQRGETRARLEVARSLLQAGMSREEVARIAGVALKNLPEV